MEAANEMALVPIEKRALAEFDITPQAVAERVAEFANLHVVPGDSKSYKQVKSAYMVLVHLRNDVDKRRKKLGEDAREWINATGKAAKELIAPTTPLEGRFKAELDAEDARIEAEKAEKIRIERERVEGIRAKIAEISLKVIDTTGKSAIEIQDMIVGLCDYVVTETEFQEFTPEALKTHAESVLALQRAKESRENWEKEQAAAKVEAERLEKQRREQETERKRLDDERKAEEARIKAERAKIEAEQAAERKRLEAIQEEVEENARMEREILHAERQKIEAEKKAQHDTKMKLRSDALYLIGLTYDGEQFHYKDINVHWTDMTVMNDVDFDALVERLKPVVEERKAEEKKAAEEEAKARAEAEAKAKVEREAREAAEKGEKERIEKERQEALAPDKEKLRNWAKSLLDMSGPILSDDASRLIASNALSMIHEAGRNIFAETEAL